MSSFIRELDAYVRNVDFVEGYYQQLTIYLAKMGGLDTEEGHVRVRKWIDKEFSEGGKFYTPSPIADVNVRDPETGDRKSMQVPLDKIFKSMEEKELVTSPALTIYYPAKFKRSLLAVFTDENIANRDRVKAEMFAAQSAGDKELANNKKNEQNSFKTRNNALSGAHSSKFTILFNKSTHSSLTSTCRSATSYGNANNEKLLAGSRHYWMPGIVINNILSTISITDWKAFCDAMELYQFHLPTVAETMECIQYSTHLFFKNPRAMDTIRELVERMSPLERAGFVYIGDLYHIRKHNPEFIRQWLKTYIEGETKPLPMDEIEEVEASIDSDMIALVSLLHSDLMGSRNLVKVKSDDYEIYRIILNSCKRILGTNSEYFTFIQEFITTPNVPASIARLPDTIRRVALVSDTDSTMGCAQEWAEWYCGEVTGKTADAIGDTMIYIATQNIGHMMAIMSTNMGVEKENTHRYSMKNEFKFSSFALTNKAKHYFSLITSQEGTIMSDYELEVKGVALRTSNIPPTIMNEFNERIKSMSYDVMNGRPIDLLELLDHVGKVEHQIYDSVINGGSEYLKTMQVKNKDGYTNPESSNYVYYELWEEVFAPKYGTAGYPPYNVVRVSVDLDNKTNIKRWIDTMEDREMAARLQGWVDRHPNKKYSMLLLPENIVATTGIPKEILDVVNYRRIIFTSVEPYYHILECFKMFFINKNRTKIVSDYHGVPLSEAA